MKKNLTPSEIEARFSEIEKRPPARLTKAEEESLAQAEAMDDGSAVSLEAFAASLEDYSGKLVLRIPKSLHKSLKDAAAIEGVSLNQYMIYKLSNGLPSRDDFRHS